MRRAIIVAVLIAAATCSLASGQKGGEWKLQFYGGMSATRDSFIHLEQPGNKTNLTFSGVSYGDQSFQQPIYYGVRALYFPKSIPWLGFGVDFIHSKVYADANGTVRATGTENGVPVDRTQRLGDSIERFSISHGVNYLCFTAIARLQMMKDSRHPGGRLIPYGGFGFGPTILHPESTIGGSSFQHYEWNVPTWQVLAGVEYFVLPDASVFVEYKYTNESFKVAVVDGTARTRVSMDHFVFGLSWRL